MKPRTLQKKTPRPPSPPDAAAQKSAPKKPAPRKKASSGKGHDELFRARPKKRLPFEFVLDELSELDPETKPMFGCTAVYVGEKIVLILRDRPSHPHDNGVWIATTAEHHASLSAEFSTLRSISVLGDGVTGWQLLPADQAEFEDAVLRVCALVRKGDPRIGKIPKKKRRALSVPAQKGIALCGSAH